VRLRLLFALVLGAASAGGVAAADRRWENPVFLTVEEAVAAARDNVGRLDNESPRALRLFVDLSLAEGDVDSPHPSSAITRQIVERFLITHPTAFALNDVQRRTIERFRNGMPRERAVVEKRLARLGYPELPGLGSASHTPA
jgi:hypothetical protein